MESKDLKGKDLERMKNRLEINNTLILSIATLTITWCSYQSTLWNGIQTFELAEANKYNRIVQENNLMILQHQAMDESIVISLVRQVLEKQHEQIKFSIDRVRPELSVVLKKWVSSDPLNNIKAPPHPMAMQEYKDLFREEIQESNKNLLLAESSWKEAEAANTYSDRYSLFTVIFSMVMFLGAITTKLSQVRVSFTMILVSGIICIVSLVLLFLYMPLAKE